MIVNIMKIIKFCEEKYHISKTETIKLSTPQYYAKHPNIMIRDFLEPKSIDYIKYKKPTLHTTQDLNKLNANSSFEGQGMLIAQNIKIVNELTKNVYIFCTMQIEDNEDPSIETGKQFSEDYDSFYTLKNPQKFADTISDLLRQEFDSEHKKIIVHAIHQKIKYKDDKTNIFDNLPDAISDRKNQDYLEIIFTKTKESHDLPGNNFEKNKEYRFAWIILDESQNALDVSEELLLPALKLRDFTN